ncbi:MAG: hypothetical protein J5872_00470 [Lachnospiraceae bacterium]|nr:hypothetical protein [Lachnospiraceae bacterium]
MAWGLAFLIVLLWIVGTSLLYGIIEALDKRYHFQSREGFAGLGRWLYRILFTIVPPILFLAVNLLIRVCARFGVLWLIIVLIAEIVCIPAYYFLKAMLQSPARLARKARLEEGDYALFEENFYKEHSRHREFDGQAPYTYLWYQFNDMAGRISYGHFFCPKKRRKAYAEAIIENNRDILPEITRWDYYDDPEIGNGYDSVLVLYCGEEERKMEINRDSARLFLWLCLKQFIKNFPACVLQFFIKTGRFLNPFRWFKKKQES